MRGPLYSQAEKVIVVRHEHPTLPADMSKVLFVLGSQPIHLNERTDLYAPLAEPVCHGRRNVLVPIV